MDALRKKTLLLLVGAGLLVAALTLVSRGTRPPAQPPDAAHHDLGSNRDCAPCHAEGAVDPLSDRHPPKDDCRHCHRPAG